ncbi:unnamed protein product [Blepharisma stoltei]|uniref:C2H2-type domain-containing protein n=1 Tax=Blepharisma stoltei TaxID=1481888 RepID=A0AAU9IQ80_9CILI|nr:unnamed protein product [Blepharisma stoltei]
MEKRKSARLLMCCLCFKLFKSRSYLARHKISHSQKRQFFCKICGNSYKYKHGLTRHEKRLHYNEWLASLWLLALKDDEKTEEKTENKEAVEDSFDVGYYLNLEDSDKENKGTKNKQKKKINFGSSVIETSPFPKVESN